MDTITFAFKQDTTKEQRAVLVAEMESWPGVMMATNLVPCDPTTDLLVFIYAVNNSADQIIEQLNKIPVENVEKIPQSGF